MKKEIEIEIDILHDDIYIYKCIINCENDRVKILIYFIHPILVI